MEVVVNEATAGADAEVGAVGQTADAGVVTVAGEETADAITGADGAMLEDEKE